MSSIRLLYVGLLCLLMTVLFAQEPDPADEYYQAEDWPNTATAYSDITKQQPTNGRAWYRLAVAQRYLKKFDAALESLSKAQENGVPISYAGYERAKLFATIGEPDQALAELDSAANAGFSNVAGLDVEALASLKGTLKFSQIGKTVERNAAPCTVDEHHGDFDFWLGEWEVHDANGNYQGSNRLTKAENGCLMEERWTSATGSTGQSMNYYDPHTAKWVQRWVSPGVLINLEGNFDEGAMRLVGDIYYYGNKTYAKFKGTWTPLEDGRVRQYFEQSTDAGETWQPWFDGYYKRKQSRKKEGQ